MNRADAPREVLVANRQEINRVIKALPGAGMTRQQSYVYGLLAGIALAERFPNTAHVIRQDFEVLIAEASHGVPERTEETILRAVAKFDTRLDT